MRLHHTLHAALPCLLAGSFPAQVPPGHYVVACARTTNAPTPQNPFPGNGGLFLVDPRNPGLPTPITNLPPGLTGRGLPGVMVGSNAVLIRDEGRELVVGGIATGPNPTTSADLYFLQLSRTVATTVRTITLGRGQAQISQVVGLPNGDLLVAADVVGSGPLFGAHLGIVGPRNGSWRVIPITLTGVSGTAWVDSALAVDQSGQTAYYARSSSSTPATFDAVLYRFAIPPMGGVVSPTVLCTVPDWVMSIATEEDGQLVVGTRSRGLLRVDPTSGPVTVTPIPGTAISGHNAVAVERATGSLIVSEGVATAAPADNWVAWLPPTGGAAARLSVTPPGGWGAITGLAVHHDPATYGQGSAGANAYNWVFPPNPSGLPTLGNSSFAVNLAAAPACGLGALLMGRRQNPPLPFLCVEVLVGMPAFASLSLPSNPSPTGPLAIPLPIPNSPPLRDKQLFLQSAHVDPQGCGLATSNGLWITIL